MNCYVIVVAITFVIFVILLTKKKKSNNFTENDEKVGHIALNELKKAISNKTIPQVDDKYLEKISDDILLVKLPSSKTKEKLSYFHAENTRYWPYYYYSFPYNYKYGGAWPPGMYSRLYYWSPGFYTGSGWSYYMRPGIGYKWWPRNRWIRNTTNGKDTYYYITNRDDYTHNAANYSDTNLVFH